MRGVAALQRGRFAWAVTAAVAALAVAVLALGVPLVGGAGADRLIAGALVVSALAATVACGVARRRSTGRLRLAWTLMALTAGCWTLGFALYLLYVLGGATSLFPNPGDVLLLGSAPLAIGGLLAFPTAYPGRSRLRSVLDALVVVGALAFVSWATVLEPLVGAAGDPLFEVAVVGYPMLAFVVASVALLVSVHARPGNRLPLGLVATGQVVLAATVVWFAYGVMVGTVDVGALGLGAMAAFLLVGLGALSPGATAESDLRAGDRTGVVASVLPYLALGFLVVGNTALDVAVRGDPVLIVSGLATVLLFGAREALMIWDNVNLRRDLEGRVEQRTAELAELNRRNDSILNAAADGIYGVDLEGRLTFINPVGASMLGYQPDELVGRIGHDVFHTTKPDGTTLPRSECAILRSMGEQTTMQGTGEQYTRQDGSTFPVRYSARPIEHSGEVVGAVIVFRDFTEEQRLARMKDEFASVVSHELRTPLTSIRGSLGLLASGSVGELTDRGQRMIDIAVSNTDRLVRLLNDILDLERMDSGRSSLDLQHCRIGDVVEGSMSVMSSMADQAGVTLEVERAEGELLADPDRLTQMLTNLLSNAIKFSAEGSSVFVEAVQEGWMLNGSVRDEGQGIPPDKLEQVFDRFQQVDASASRKQGGTGLGLSICRSIVERHGGSIWAESEPGAGTTVRFTLPALSGPGPDSAPSGATTVLVCDDDPSTVEVFAKQLEAGGYRALRTRSADDALARARAESPDAIVLDLLMPEKDGWQTLAELRAHPATRDIPVVICSLIPEEHGDSDQPVAGWLTKPFKPETLLPAIQRAIGEAAAPTVLLVEDDPDLGERLAGELGEQGLYVAHADSTAAAVDRLRAEPPHLVVLDLAVTGSEELDLVEVMRQEGLVPDVPLLVYTGEVLTEVAAERLDDTQADVVDTSRSSSQIASRVRDLLDRLSPPSTASSTVAGTADEAAGQGAGGRDRVLRTDGSGR